MRLKTFFAMIAMVSSAYAGEPGYVAKSIGGQHIRLPLIAGMVAACDQDQALRERAMAMTPASSEFVTCFATPATMKGIRQHAGPNAYPFMAIMVVREQKGGSLTEAEFAQIRELSRQRMAAMVTAPGSRQAELNRQDDAIAAKGGTLKRKSEGVEFLGFHEYTNERPSFTYVVSRKMTLSESGVTAPMCEVSSASSLFINGRMLGVMVIDHCAGSPVDQRATSLSREWLMAFEKTNGAETRPAH